MCHFEQSIKRYGTKKKLQNLNAIVCGSRQKFDRNLNIHWNSGLVPVYVYISYKLSNASIRTRIYFTETHVFSVFAAVALADI